ncbi:MAG: response regulator transcription factor [Rhodocyclales bacterium]|nr:response regulator transcription factor [Rhodocyclales bacterium]
MIEILMADDHAIFRSGLRRLLSDEADMRIVAEAANGLEAMEQLRKRAFGLVLLDVNMGGRSGFETLRRIHAEWPSQPVLMLSMYPETQYAQLALEAGAHGYLSKDRDAAQLVAAIRVAASGGYYLPPGLSPSQLASPPRQAPHLCLTEREQQILRLILQGISLTDIGTRLCLSVKTVSTYRTRLLNKLGLNSNAELVRYCLEHGVGD